MTLEKLASKISEIIEEKRHNPDCRTCEGCLLLDDIKLRVAKIVMGSLRAERTRLKAEFLKLVPEERDRNDDSDQILFNEGWNACRAEILKRLEETFVDSKRTDIWYSKGKSGTVYSLEKGGCEASCWHCGKTFLCERCDATCRLCGAPFDRSRCEEFGFIEKEQP